jgi:hypothetical protein
VKEVNKEREDCRANKVSAEIAENRVRRELLEKRAFRVIRVQEEIKESVEIRGRMEILDQWVSQDYKENQVKKDCQVIEENKVTRDQEAIEAINWRIIIFY